MRILVTGGAGYIGCFAIVSLQAAGHDVVVYDDGSTGHPEVVTANVIRGDICDSYALNTCLDENRFEGIVHLAAINGVGRSMIRASRFFQVNTAASINLLDAAERHGIRYFVFASSTSVYGSPQTIPVEESHPIAPTNVYGESKLLVERVLPWYDRAHGIRSVILRFCNAAGAALDGSMGQDRNPPAHVLPLAIQAALGQLDRLMILGADYDTPDGTCVRDYVHVLDLALALVRALDYLAAGGPSDVFNVGSGTGFSTREVVNTLKHLSGVDFPIEIGPHRPFDSATFVANVSKIRDALGWEPKYSDLETIVSSAWRWHKAHPLGYKLPGRAGVNVA
jgi:UDP-glucose 4-epimerase